MLHDIFAACELYRRLYERVRNAQVAGICYRTMSHAMETSTGQAVTPPEASAHRYVDLLWQLEECLEAVSDALGEQGYWRWASARLLGCDSAEEAWQLWLTLRPSDRPDTLGQHGRWVEHWQSDLRTGDLVLDRELQAGRLLRRAA